MVGLSETTLLALSFTFSVFTPQTTPSASLNEILTPVKEQAYVVKKGDSLGNIAKEIYGNEAYWTIIWNDNETLANPDIIHSGLELKIRNDKPIFIELPQREYKRKAVQILPELVAFQHQSGSNPLSEEQLIFLGSCEAGMNPSTNTGNGYYGAFQFTIGTWNSMNTGYERADLAPLEVQKDAVQRLLVRSSIFTQFPACARKMQAIGLI